MKKIKPTVDLGTVAMVAIGLAYGFGRKHEEDLQRRREREDRVDKEMQDLRSEVGKVKYDIQNSMDLLKRELLEAIRVRESSTLSS